MPPHLPITLQNDNTLNYLHQQFLLSIKPEYQRIVWILVVGLILTLGAYLRLDQFWFNRSLWLDEAFIANQVARGDWASFFSLPMEYSHFAPPMFGVMGRLSVALFGDSDLSLRIYPQLCALISLPLFYALTRRLLTPWAVLISLFLFAISPFLILHASNLKQYSSDVTFTLTLLLAFTYIPSSEHPQFNLRLSLFTLLGVVSLWFSHPSLFILASIGLCQVTHYLTIKDKHSVFKMLGIGTAWLSSFAIIYFIINGGDISKSSPISTWLFIFWHIVEKAFFPGLTSEGMVWLYHSLMNFFEAAGLIRPLSIIGFSLVGMIILFRQQRALFALLLLPIGITLFASYLKQYVFFGRLILFLLPFFFIFVGISIAQLGSQFSLLQGIPFFNVIVGVLLTVFLLTPSIKYPFSHEIMIEENRSALEYLQQHKSENDKIYVYHWATPAFHYYAPFYGFNYDNCQHITPPDIDKGSFKEIDFYWSHKKNILVTKKGAKNVQCILGFSEDFAQSTYELAKLKGHGRIWLFFTHIGHKDKQKFLNYLATFATVLDEKNYPAASVYLYDMGDDT
jgi:hypothetical protein